MFHPFSIKLAVLKCLCNCNDYFLNSFSFSFRCWTNPRCYHVLLISLDSCIVTLPVLPAHDMQTMLHVSKCQWLFIQLYLWQLLLPYNPASTEVWNDLIPQKMNKMFFQRFSKLILTTLYHFGIMKMKFHVEKTHCECINNAIKIWPNSLLLCWSRMSLVSHSLMTFEVNDIKT